ncbi:hypothetical protein ACEQ8H_006179 [Pleosporales sp. CAS-2024a]
MAARGARSRKLQAKEVEEMEKKVGKTKAIGTIHEPHDAFADWRPTSNTDNAQRSITRTLTSSSRRTSQSSSTNGSSNRPRLPTIHSSSASDARHAQSSASVSNLSTSSKEKKVYDAKGKETKAPRGRGAGVPIKRTVVPSPAPPAFRHESAPSSPWTTNQKTWLNFKRWDGGKEAMRPYGGFQFDEDLSTGSVLIFFKEEQVDDERPLPSIRARLDVLENSGSTWLKQTLNYSRIADSDDAWALPTMSELSAAPHDYSHYPEPRRRMLRPTSPGGRSPPPFDIDQSYDGRSVRASSMRETFSDVGRSHGSNADAVFRQPLHEPPTHKIWFTAPEQIRTAQGQRLYHVAIRNFLAMLHGKPIVGADLFDMLSTLQPQIEDMYRFDDSQSRISAHRRSIQMVLNYLIQRGIDDVRSSVKNALCLLAWSELEHVKWRQGYLESFVHLAGVMVPELEDVPEFKRLSIVTRRNLGIAAKTLQLRRMEAEEKLASFDLSDLWGDTSRHADSPVYQSYQAFRSFLVNHYSRNYGNWPPSSDKAWLNRRVALALQEDLGSLYDYLVNRDVIWNPREERATRKWEMAHRKDDGFKADVPELGITDLLVRFDAQFGFAHIPHPYPLLPRHIPKSSKEKEKKSFFSAVRRDKTKGVTKDAKTHLQLSILFSDATNIDKLDVNFHGTTLIDKFEQFEMTTDLNNMTPREARLGRWLLLYGILQVLSTIAVDVQGLKHTDGVRYLLCTDLKRCPEWVTNGQLEYLEASQRRSWCWQRSWDPAPIHTAPVELEALPQTPPPAPDANHMAYDQMYQDRHTDRDRDRDRDRDHDRSPPSSSSLDAADNKNDSNMSRLSSEIQRINEKIDDLSLSSSARHHFTPEVSQRRENEKVIHADLPNWTPPRTDSLSQPPPHLTPPSLARLPNFDLTVRPHPRGAPDTDHGGYPSSGGEGVQWPGWEREGGHGGGREWGKEGQEQFEEGG